MPKNNNNVGKKFDKEKLRWDLLPIKPVESIVRVLMLGSFKYGDDNWKKVPECRRRYYAASLRHLTEWWEGEKIDPESGESHLGHAMCCLIFLMWHELNNTKEFLGTQEEEEQEDNPATQQEQTKLEEKLENVKTIFENVGLRIEKWCKNIEQNRN